MPSRANARNASAMSAADPVTVPQMVRPPNATPTASARASDAEAFRAFAREGIDHLQVWLNPATAEGVDQLAEVLHLLDSG